MSYREPSQAFGYHTRYLLSKRGEFPTGLLGYVIGYLNKANLKFNLIELRIPPLKLQNRLIGAFTHKPYPEQLEAANAAIKARRGIIAAPTGLGKSMIIALIIEKAQVPTLVVVPSLELKSQLTQSLSNIFGAANVGKGKPIWVANVDSLDTGKPAAGYGAVIIDEFHHAAATTYRKLNTKAWAGVYHRWGLTATPFRSQDHERLLLEGVLSRVIYKVSYADAVAKGYIVPLEAYYIEVTKKNTEAHTWQQVYKELIVDNEVRNKLILDLLHTLSEAGKSTLCLVKEINHGEKLFPFPFIHGVGELRSEILKDFNSTSTKVVVGTTGVLGEGVDTKACEYVIIAGLGKSRNSIMQMVGRGFRIYSGKESCKVILVLDKSHKFTKSHFKEQCKILLEEYNVIPIKI